MRVLSRGTWSRSVSCATVASFIFGVLFFRNKCRFKFNSCVRYTIFFLHTQQYISALLTLLNVFTIKQASGTASYAMGCPVSKSGEEVLAAHAQAADTNRNPFAGKAAVDTSGHAAPVAQAGGERDQSDSEGSFTSSLFGTDRPQSAETLLRDSLAESENVNVRDIFVYDDVRIKESHSHRTNHVMMSRPRHFRRTKIPSDRPFVGNTLNASTRLNSTQLENTDLPMRSASVFVFSDFTCPTIDEFDVGAVVPARSPALEAIGSFFFHEEFSPQETTTPILSSASEACPYDFWEEGIALRAFFHLSKEC